MRSENQQLLQSDQALTKDQIIKAFDEAYEDLISAAIAVMKRSDTHRIGEWKPREVLAHIAGWAAFTTFQLPQIIAGMPPPIYSDENQHTVIDNATNAGFLALIGNQSFEQILDIAHQTHLNFVQMLQEQDESFFAPENYVYDRMRRVIIHHLDHAHELEKVAELR